MSVFTRQSSESSANSSGDNGSSLFGHRRDSGRSSHSYHRRRRVRAHVEVVNIKDYKKAAKTLHIAFKDDLYLKYLTDGIKDTKLKGQLDLALYEATVYSTVLSGLVVAIRDVELEKTDPDAPFLAVACFEKPRPMREPKSLISSLWSMYKGGYLKFIWLANRETRQRVLFEQSSMLEKFRYEALGEEFSQSWYLSDIGAIPKGRGKGYARALVDYVCHKYVDKYRPHVAGDEADDEYEDDEELNELEKDHGSIPFNNSDNSQLDSEIQSYNFSFDLESEDLTDYSGYSSVSDSDASSSHSSWYYREEDDILAQYDRKKSKENKVGAPLYLESSHPRNRKIYQKLGFTYVKTVDVARVTDRHGRNKMLTMDLMVRGPKGARWTKKPVELPAEDK